MSINIGSIILDEADRDAIHIAIFPLTAIERLCRGYYVKLAVSKFEAIRCTDRHDAIGIVDPFLECEHVEKGERFWCFLFPNSITGLRHHWTHPAFDTGPDVHKKWLLEFCDKWKFDCDELLEAATSDVGYRYATAYGRDLHDKSQLDEGEYELFWYHIEKFIGQKFDEAHREGLQWTCSC